MSWSICCSLPISLCIILSTCKSCACTCSSSGFGVTSAILACTWSMASLWCFKRSALWLCAWMVCHSSCFSVPTSPSHTSSSLAMLIWRSAFRSPPPPLLGSMRLTRSETILIFSFICSILTLIFWTSFPTFDSDWRFASRIMTSTCCPMSRAMSWCTSVSMPGGAGPGPLPAIAVEPFPRGHLGHARGTGGARGPRGRA
mmetsp:Transcript_56851/g.137385  ORF Transcript_56851/g.137385 Transcript_56851/m.137385 type:complete len:200 (-) Transcript_56851:2-601(-)